MRQHWINRLALVGTAVVYVTIVIVLWFDRSNPGLPIWLDGYFIIDTIGLLFLSIMTIVFAAAALYSLYYFNEYKPDSRREAIYVAAMLLFVGAMTGVILAAHLALLWVLVEATTLTSAVLIYFEGKKSSLEAAWKYIFICSIGIALAFVGIVILTIGSKEIGSLFFADLYNRAGQINPFWLKLAFAFILVGFGTKIGIAPIHAWLPDAHSEAPSPVSALLSGTLLNTTFLGLLRVQEIMIRADLQAFSNFLFMATGFLSLLVSAAFLLRTVNYKRMLAYSSIENMGLLFIGIALGKTGIYAAMLHSVAHSLTKSALFLTSGNILQLFGSKRIDDVHGLLEKDPRSGWIWMISLIAIIGIPPFPAFLSKFLLIKAFFENGSGWLAAPFFLLIAVIVFGMGGAVFRMSFGDLPISSENNVRLHPLAYIPQIVLLLILLVIGLNIPESVQMLLVGAAGFLH
ncbi:hypothetical protein KJ762_05740 [bacterium]|nr:hypothetical protein [bacterium]MBU1874227.1 hypothetical protein [bacterium]